MKSYKAKCFLLIKCRLRIRHLDSLFSDLFCIDYLFYEVENPQSWIKIADY